MCVCLFVSVSDLRIVLLGKNASENNRVRNLILNKEVFGKKGGRKITIFSSTHLLNPDLKLQAMVKKVSEFSPPEPHVIILVLQHNDFSKKHREILHSVLRNFGEQAMDRTMIVTTDHKKQITKHENEYIQEICRECGGCCLQLTQNTQRSQILNKLDEIVARSGFKETQQSSSLNQVDSK